MTDKYGNMSRKFPTLKRNCKCTFCDRTMKTLWKIPNPNFDLNDDIDWFTEKSWWYVCRSCKQFIKEKQQEDFDRFTKKFKEKHGIKK